MLKRTAAWVWRRIPKQVRRLGLLLTEARFTVTAGVVVIDNCSDDRGRVLLLHHRFRAGSGWGIPGGFIRKGEDPADAIRRELREEIGLEIETPRIVFARTLQAQQQVEIIFTCRPRGAPAIVNFEIINLEWFDLTSLPENLSDDQRDLIERACKAMQ